MPQLDTSLLTATAPIITSTVNVDSLLILDIPPRRSKRSTMLGGHVASLRLYWFDPNSRVGQGRAYRILNSAVCYLENQGPPEDAQWLRQMGI